MEDDHSVGMFIAFKMYLDDTHRTQQTAIEQSNSLGPGRNGGGWGLGMLVGHRDLASVLFCEVSRAERQ